MKNFSKDLRKHATKIISYEKKEMIPLYSIKSEIIAIILENIEELLMILQSKI